MFNSFMQSNPFGSFGGNGGTPSFSGFGGWNGQSSGNQAATGASSGVGGTVNPFGGGGNGMQPQGIPWYAMSQFRSMYMNPQQQQQQQSYPQPFMQQTATNTPASNPFSGFNSSTYSAVPAFSPWDKEFDPNIKPHQGLIGFNTTDPNNVIGYKAYDPSMRRVGGMLENRWSPDMMVSLGKMPQNFQSSRNTYHTGVGNTAPTPQESAGLGSLINVPTPMEGRKLFAKGGLVSPMQKHENEDYLRYGYADNYEGLRDAYANQRGRKAAERMDREVRRPMSPAKAKQLRSEVAQGGVEQDYEDRRERIRFGTD